MIVIRLSWSEVFFAAMAGVMRRIQGMKHKREQMYGGGPCPDMFWQIDIISCIGEFALAKHLDCVWSGAIGLLTVPDVGPGYEVRATEWSDGRLRLHPPDKDEKPYVLARVNENVVTLVGWVYARVGKRKEYWQNIQKNRPERFAFWVPNDMLHDMDELPVLERAA